jgi:hypothetical protein
VKSPGTILRLWTRAVKKHEEGKKPAELPKKGQEQKLKIEKGLRQLKVKGRADLADPKARTAFEGTRDRLAKTMMNYCRYLKSAKDEDKKALPKYLKTVKQLTVVVKKLVPDDLEEEEEEVGLETLDEVDVADLDEALEQPADEVEEKDEEEEEEADDETDDEAAPSADGKAVLQRLSALAEGYKTAVAAKGPDVSRMQALFGAVNGLVKNKDYEQAGKVLDELEPLVRKSAPGVSSADAAAAFAARLKELMPRVLEAQKAKPAIATDLKLGVSEANVFARKKDFAQAGALLDKVERLLGGDSAKAPADGDVVKRFNGLAGSIKAALAAKGPDMARIQTLAGAVGGLIKNEDYTQASKVLDELEPLLGKTAGAPGGDAALQGEFARTKAELYAAIPRAAAVSPDHKDKLIRLLGLASKHEKAKEFGPGLGVLEDLREAIEEAMAAEGAEGAEGAEEAPLPEVKDMLNDGLAVWRTAQERVGVQITNLQQALRKTGDPDFVRIADLGLNGVTDGLQVGLQAALIDLSRANAQTRPQAVARVSALLGKYEAELQSNAIIRLCDTNVFGVKVAIRATLGAALTQIKKGLAAQRG